MSISRPTDTALAARTAGPPDDASSIQARRGGRRAWAVAIVLAALSTMSFLDRQILALLIPDLRRDLGLSDVQAGLLLGPAFFVVYNLALLPAAVLVDRWNRKWTIVIGVTIWSVMTIASGFAQDFNHLLALRGGLAFGEALLGPAAISLLGDLFDRTERPLPTAAYITGSVVGSTGSAMLTAILLQLAGMVAALAIAPALSTPWRLTLIAGGLPSLALALVLAILAREPARTQDDVGPAELGGESLAAHLHRRGLLYGGVFLGIGLILMVGTSVAIWGPLHMIRAFGVSQIWTGYMLGGVSLAAGVGGTLAIPVVIRDLVRKGRMHALVQFTVVAMGLTIAAAVMGGFARGIGLAITGFALVMFLASGVGTLPTLVIQLYAPAHLRGRVAAGLFFLLYLLGTGIAPVLIPILAGSVFSGPTAMGHALGVFALVFGGLGALMFAGMGAILSKAEAEAQGRTAT